MPEKEAKFTPETQPKKRKVKTENLTILLFTSRYDPASCTDDATLLFSGTLPDKETGLFSQVEPTSTIEQAKKLEQELIKHSYNVKLVIKNTSNLDDLKLVAKYRVITTPCIVVSKKNGKEAYRRQGLGTEKTLLRSLKYLSRCYNVAQD